MANTKKNQYLRRSKPKKIIGGVPPPTEPPRDVFVDNTLPISQSPRGDNNGNYLLDMMDQAYSFDQLITAIQKNNIDLIRTLINNDNVNLHKNGTTPLHHASSIGNTEVVKLLIEKGADINVKNNFGSTPLHYASNEGNTEVVKLLIDNGADINVKDRADTTPLHKASFKGHTEVVNLLIENGADIHVKDNSGDTPLKVANEYGRTEVVHLLFEKGAGDQIDDVDNEYESMYLKPYGEDSITLQNNNQPNPYNSSSMLYHVIEGEVNYDDYIKDSNNLIFIYNNTPFLISRLHIKSLIHYQTHDPTNIVYKCNYTKPEAHIPKDEDINTNEPALNMGFIGISGVIVPLQYLDAVITSTNQIFDIDIEENKIPIVSLNVRLRNRNALVSANHCQGKDFTKGTLSYREINSTSGSGRRRTKRKGVKSRKSIKGKSRKNRRK
jgi:ankyrin repeat protein